MSVRYTATWYDVMQAQQHHTHQSSTVSYSSHPPVCGVCPAAHPVARSQKNLRPVHLKSSANLGKSSANFQKHQFHNALYIKN